VTLFDPESAPFQVIMLTQFDGDSRHLPIPRGLGGERIPCRMLVTARLRLGWIRRGWAEDEAYSRLIETPDLEDWHEALGAWLRAVRTLKREK